ncbi:MAG: M20/M25/M40 family metallo-hydrolase [Acidobacteria bacterium]|nr:M20/M25/M40 family metallo-hydrolase [Acidobacteriota bacterium]
MPARRSFSIIACVLASWQLVRSQPADLRTKVDQWVQANQRALVSSLVDLLSIPNVAADRENIRRNAMLLRDQLAARGFTAEILETAGNPLVFGEFHVPGATRTILFYEHYDGQPVNPRDWRQPSPFTPILRDGRMEDGAKEIPNGLTTLRTFDPEMRIYARSASDDKSPFIAFCAALDVMKALGIRPTSNIKLILDGEEEAGSPSLVPAISKYRDRLSADVMYILDGPLHPSGQPTVVFGARGNLAIELTVYGPKFALHSGHYGNWAPNPAMRLAQLLATMKDEQGRVTIEGFYTGVTPLTAEEQAMLRAVPDDPTSLTKLFGIASPEREGLSLQEALQLPSLNVRGLSSAFVGADARTIIPDKAIAAIDVRLVKETPADRMARLVRDHISRQGWHIVDREPDDATRAKFSKIVRIAARGGTNAYRTSPLLPISKQTVSALAGVFGQPPVQIRTSGGTVPITPFIEALGFPAMSLPIVNFDNNQHGENENLRLGHFFRGVTTFAAILTM